MTRTDRRHAADAGRRLPAGFSPAARAAARRPAGAGPDRVPSDAQLTFPDTLPTRRLGADRGRARGRRGARIPTASPCSRQGRVDRLADVAWSDRATAMLQFVIVQAFQASGRLSAVGTDRDDLPGRYLLQSTLDAFQLEPEGEGYAADGHAARPAAAAARPRGRGCPAVHPPRAGDRTLERRRDRRLRCGGGRRARGSGRLDAAGWPGLTPGGRLRRG